MDTRDYKMNKVRPASQAGQFKSHGSSGLSKRPQTQMSSVNGVRAPSRQSKTERSSSRQAKRSFPSPSSSQQQAKSLNTVKEDEEVQPATKSKLDVTLKKEYGRGIYFDFYFDGAPNKSVELKIIKGVEYRMIQQLLCKLQELAMKKPDWNNYLPSGVRYIFDLKTKKEVTNVDQLKSGRIYVLSSRSRFNHNIKYGQKT